MTARGRGQRGVTLMEVLIAVTLLSLLSAGMLTAMRVGLDALNKANDRLMDNRRVAAVERILSEQVAGFVPVVAQCRPEAPEAAVQPMPFFQGEPEVMRFVSTYSLGEAWRGTPSVLEYLVIPGENGVGVRLVVNEVPYTSPAGAGLLCLGRMPDPVTGTTVPRFRPPQAGPNSFVLADKLARCRFLYLEPAPQGAPAPVPDRWRPDWVAPTWPLGVRIEMEPLDTNPARLHVTTVTAPMHVKRSPEIRYVDE